MELDDFFNRYGQLRESCLPEPEQLCPVCGGKLRPIRCPTCRGIGYTPTAYGDLLLGFIRRHLFSGEQQ